MNTLKALGEVIVQVNPRERETPTKVQPYSNDVELSNMAGTWGEEAGEEQGTCLRKFEAFCRRPVTG